MLTGQEDKAVRTFWIQEVFRMSGMLFRRFAMDFTGLSLLGALLMWLALSSASMAFAQAGRLDTSFATGGIFSDNFNGATGFATAVALQTDGKIVAVGESGTFGESEGDGEVVRLNTNGTLDTGFGSGGVVTIRCADFENEIVGVAIQTDGKIVASCAAGIGESELVRLNTNGSFDSSFGNGGFVGLELSAHPGPLVLQPDGKIVVLESGGNATQMQRFNTNGQLDTTFGSGGAAALAFTGSAIQLLSDGKFLVTTFGFAAGEVARYNSNGSLDTSFGISGQSAALAAPGIAVQANGAIVLAGSIITQTALTGNSSGFGIARLNQGGAIDGTFGKHGAVVTPFLGFTVASAFPLTIQSNGDIVAAGTASSGGNQPVGSFALARYLSNGGLDSSFGTGGLVTTSFGTGTDASIGGIVIQSDGKIVVAGNNSQGEFVVARYLGQ